MVASFHFMLPCTMVISPFMISTDEDPVSVNPLSVNQYPSIWYLSIRYPSIRVFSRLPIQLPLVLSRRFKWEPALSPSKHDPLILLRRAFILWKLMRYFQNISQIIIKLRNSLKIPRHSLRVD